MTRRKLISLIAGLALILGACDGSEPSVTTESQPETTTGAEPETTTGAEPETSTTAGVQGPTAEVTVAQGSGPANLDPHKDESRSIFSIQASIFEALTWIDNEGALQPLLAESWELLDDRTWQFKLRPDVTFHNGEEFNAETVAFSIERMLDPEVQSVKLTRLGGVERAEVVDPLTVDIITTDPFPGLPAAMSQLLIQPIEHTSTNDEATIGTEPVGTGPYRLVEFTRDLEVVVEAFPEYWGEQPSVARIVWRTIPDAATRMSALQAGEVDLISGVPPEFTLDLESDGFTVVGTGAGLGLVLFFDTLGEGPLQDVRVRQALNYAVDKESILENLLGGHGRVLDGQILTIETLGYNEDLDPYPYDIERARELLAEAGYADGFDLDFKAPQGRYLKDREMAEAVAAQLGEVGVRVNLTIMEFSPFITELRDNIEACCEMYLLAIYSTPLFDADLPLPFFTTGQNLSGFSNPEVDALVQAGRSEFDPDERERIYHEATQILFDEAAALYMFDMPSIYAHSGTIIWTPRSDDVILYRDFASAESG